MTWTFNYWPTWVILNYISTIFSSERSSESFLVSTQILVSNVKFFVLKKNANLISFTSNYSIFYHEKLFCLFHGEKMKKYWRKQLSLSIPLCVCSFLGVVEMEYERFSRNYTTIVHVHDHWFVSQLINLQFFSYSLFLYLSLSFFSSSLLWPILSRSNLFSSIISWW